MADEGSVTGVQTDTGDAAAAAEAAAAAAADDKTILTGDAAADAAAAKVAAEAAAAEDTGKEGGDDSLDTYADFVMPDGVQLDETALAEANPIFKELGLDQEQAQKVVDLYAKQIQAGAQKNIDAFNQLTTEWRDAAKNDKEFGGDKFDENVKIAQNAVDKFGTSELKQLLTDHGVGNHPEMIRFMVRVGHTLKEDIPGVTGSLSSPTNDRISILYPNETKE